MGCCCSCLESESEASASSETEMQQRSAPASRSNKSLSVSRAMSAPSVEVGDDGLSVSGFGLALVGVPIEQEGEFSAIRVCLAVVGSFDHEAYLQEAAYWEAHVEMEASSSQPQEFMFGVSTKKDQRFFKELEDLHEDSPEAQGTALMRKIKVSDGDVVGIAVQHSDLPMVQFSLNGEPLHDEAVNRFKGNVYPAVYLLENDGASIKLVFNESDFRQISPHARFGPVIIARGII